MNGTTLKGIGYACLLLSVLLMTLGLVSIFTIPNPESMIASYFILTAMITFFAGTLLYSLVAIKEVLIQIKNRLSLN